MYDWDKIRNFASANNYLQQQPKKNERIMERKEIERLLSAYDEECSGVAGNKYRITDEIKMEDGAVLLLFDGCVKSSAVCYDDGTVFVLDDWQGPRPEAAEEVGDYGWVSLDGRRAINLDGLPRLLL